MQAMRLLLVGRHFRLIVRVTVQRATGYAV